MNPTRTDTSWDAAFDPSAMDTVVWHPFTILKFVKDIELLSLPFRANESHKNVMPLL